MANEDVKFQNIQYVLTCADELIQTEGVQNTSLRRIAEKSRISIRSIHRYFPGKNDIVCEVYNRGVDEQVQYVRKLLKQVDNRRLAGEELVRSMFDMTDQYSKEQSSRLQQLMMMRLYLAENGQKSDVNRMLAGCAIQYRETLERGIREWLVTSNCSLAQEKASEWSKKITKTIRMVSQGAFLEGHQEREEDIIGEYLGEAYSYIEMFIQKNSGDCDSVGTESQ